MTVLLTGATGFIGRVVYRWLCESGFGVIGIDRWPAASGKDEKSSACNQVLACDLTDPASLDALFASHRFDAVIHLAAVLPSAASKDPIGATRVNVDASLALLERTIRYGVQRFVFGSSTSVYGAAGADAPISEHVPAAPTDVYGGGKRAVEIVGENLQKNDGIEFVALRIATVVGAGARNTSSAWRSEIFEKLGSGETISLPYAADDPLTVVHVDDVARMLLTLTQTRTLQHAVYNTPAELLTAAELKRIIEFVAPEARIELTGRTRPLAPLADGSRFALEFGFELTSLEQHLRAKFLQSSNQI